MCLDLLLGEEEGWGWGEKVRRIRHIVFELGMKGRKGKK